MSFFTYHPLRLYYFSGTLKHNPLGPNSRVIIGVDAILGVWGDWYKIAPDNIMLANNSSAYFNKKTGANECTFIEFVHLFD